MIYLRSVVVVLGIAFTFSFSANVAAIDYYFSSTDGDDRLDGRSNARSRDTGPFATLKRVESLSLKATDRVLLKCGDRFSGPVALRLSLLQTDLVTIGSYGNCDSVRRPIIDGRLLLAHAPEGRVTGFNTATVIEQVFSDGVPLFQARYPEEGYLIIPDGQPGLTENLPRLPQLETKDLSGAQLKARTQEWFIEARLIESQDQRLDSALRYPLRPRTGFYLTGKSWMVADRDAWTYDRATKELVIRAPRGVRLDVVPAGNLFEVTGTASLQISGIDFIAAGADALNVRLNGFVSIQKSTFKYASGNGVSVSGSSSFSITDSSIESTGLDGIFLAEVRKSFVQRNFIIGAGMLGHPNSSLAAINAHRTESATITENSVVNAAYHGIRFSGDARILRNYVRDSCRRLSDCGAIYTWRRNAQDERPKAEVVGNFVFDVSGDAAVKLGVNDWFAGIYLDDYSNNIEVRDNVVVGSNQGIYLHNARNISVRNNIAHARNISVVEKVDHLKDDNNFLPRNIIEKNIIFSGDFSFDLKVREGANEEFSIERSPDFELRFFKQSGSSRKLETKHKCGDIFSKNLMEGSGPRAPLISYISCD